MHVRRCCGSESEETGHQSEGVIESTVGEEKSCMFLQWLREKWCRRDRGQAREFTLSQL